MKTIRSVIGQDTHIPFQDKRVVKLFLEFLVREQPDRVYANGDICDFYSLSRFDKKVSRINSLQADLDETHLFLSRIRDSVPNAEIHYMRGNHERRLQKYKWSQAKATDSLRCMTVPQLLKLDKLDIAYHEKGVFLGDLYIKHGDLVRKHAGYTARGEFEKEGCSGISGHTHRDGKYTVRNRSGQYAWWENFCMCDLEPEYINSVANWSQGWTLVTTIRKRPYVEQIAVIGGKYIYGGKMHG